MTRAQPKVQGASQVRRSERLRAGAARLPWDGSTPKRPLGPHVRAGEGPRGCGWPRGSARPRRDRRGARHSTSACSRRENENADLERRARPGFTAASLTGAEPWPRPGHPAAAGRTGSRVHGGTPLGRERGELSLLAATRADLGGVCAEQTESNGARQTPRDLTYLWTQNNTKPVGKKQTKTETDPRMQRTSCREGRSWRNGVLAP